MHAFYCPDLGQSSKEYKLIGKEFNHFKVLRISVGKQLLLANGNGLQATAQIKNISKNYSQLEILSFNFRQGPKCKIDLAFGLIKDKTRLGFLIEKASELGVNKIIPIVTEYTQKKSIKTEKLQSKATSALKQSKGYHLSLLMAAASFEEIIELAKKYNTVYLADSGGGKLEKIDNSEKVLLLVGPEAGFSESEMTGIERLSNVKKIRLSDNILRTETACLSLVSRVTI